MGVLICPRERQAAGFPFQTKRIADMRLSTYESTLDLKRDDNSKSITIKHHASLQLVRGECLD